MMDRWVLAFTEPIRGARVTNLFCKALYAFVLIKIVLSWLTFTELAEVNKLSIPRSLVALIVHGPGLWAAQHMAVFLVIFAAVLMLALWLRPNYFTAFLIAWLWVILYRLSSPVSNGADQVTLMLLCLAIPLSASPVATRPVAEILQRGAYHAAHLYARLYVCAIYFVSGIDKVSSEGWRSGEALNHLRDLRYLLNPALSEWLPVGGPGTVVLVWLTIGFELLFPVLVWFAVTRKWILSAGIIFHMVIGAVLSLPDFAAVMIISYLVFIDLQKQRSKFKVQGSKLDGSNLEL